MITKLSSHSPYSAKELELLDSAFSTILMEQRWKFSKALFHKQEMAMSGKSIN